MVGQDCHETCLLPNTKMIDVEELNLKKSSH